MLTNFGKDMIDKLENACKSAYLGSISIQQWKIHVLGVFWKSFFEDDIQPEIQVPPPPEKKNIYKASSSKCWELIKIAQNCSRQVILW